MSDTSPVTAACPECRSGNCTEYRGTLRVCKSCGQDWHTDLDYKALAKFRATLNSSKT